jgi:hypothetical protein
MISTKAAERRRRVDEIFTGAGWFRIDGRFCFI